MTVSIMVHDRFHDGHEGIMTESAFVMTGFMMFARG